MAVKRTKKIEIEEKNKALSEKLPEVEPKKVSTPPPLPLIAAPVPAPPSPASPAAPAMTPSASSSSPVPSSAVIKTKKAEKPGTNRVKKTTMAEKKKQLETKKK